MIKVQKPTSTSYSMGGDVGSQETHPAYGVIGASRVTSSGGDVLFNSDFRHRGFVRVRIRTATLKRNLSHDWIHGGEELIEVDLSEAQWAGFVSTLNMGDGVPCTVRAINNVQVPEIPLLVDRAAQFKAEMAGNTDLQGLVDELRSEIKALKASGVTRDKLDSIVVRLGNMLKPHTDYVAKCFSDHVETMIERAKSEVGAYVQGVLVRTGLRALAEPGAGPLMLEDGRADAIAKAEGREVG